MDGHTDLVVIGAGAAGIFAALAARGVLAPDGTFQPVAPGSETPSVLLLDGQERPGKKILISGGGRCNVTNVRTGVPDYMSGVPNAVRSILREFPPEAVKRFFASRDVPLAKEPMGKVFPHGEGRARDILRALLGAAEEAGVVFRFGHKVETVEPDGDGWRVDDVHARRVIVATGGLSIPSTGSTGFGYGVARAAGHELVPTIPALAPLTSGTTVGLAGMTLPAILSVVDATGREEARAAGSMLFTHRGVSGPVALDISGPYERAIAEGRDVRVLADFWTLCDRTGVYARYLEHTKPPGACLPKPPRPTPPAAFEKTILEMATRGPRRKLGSFLCMRLPRRLVAHLAPSADKILSQLSKEGRREAARAVTAFDLKINGTEGYGKAEVTAGGVSLTELQRRTMESRNAPGLHFCGEVCDVTGRLGGFNFQWAWASGYLAGKGAALAVAAPVADAPADAPTETPAETPADAAPAADDPSQ